MEDSSDYRKKLFNTIVIGLYNQLLDAFPLEINVDLTELGAFCGIEYAEEEEYENPTTEDGAEFQAIVYDTLKWLQGEKYIRKNKESWERYGISLTHKGLKEMPQVLGLFKAQGTINSGTTNQPS